MYKLQIDSKHYQTLPSPPNAYEKTKNKRAVEILTSTALWFALGKGQKKSSYLDVSASI
ncbi:hypothetical protein [Aneurinibacillus sp. XH2]|uniref:hypothetical protein n=1 Tax=Aneurinibacillus sp. XH2 TaxID=1450761 RepID=UPI00138EE830|nr:hypothetical protein [Aneurinibacillus sp. XH2]